MTGYDLKKIKERTEGDKKEIIRYRCCWNFNSITTLKFTLEAVDSIIDAVQNPVSDIR